MTEKNVFDSEEECLKSVKPIVDIPWEQKHKINEQVVENPTLSNYNQMPVTQFGMNMLQRMGWKEGRGIGKNTKNALLQPIEIIPRHHRLGLGAEPAPQRYKRKGNDIKGMVSQSGKGYKFLDEKAVTRESLGFKINSEVMIVTGKHKGLEAIILQIKGETKGERVFKVELKLNDEAVTLDEIQIVMKKSYKNNQSESSEDSQSKGNASYLSRDSSCKKEKHTMIRDLDSLSKSRSRQKQKKLKWVAVGLCVKVNSKTFQSGKFYNKKIKIHDILDKFSFLATDMKGEEMLEDLNESDLKPIVPDAGEKIKIVKGQYKGSIGLLSSYDKKKKTVELYLDEYPNILLVLRKKEVCELIC